METDKRKVTFETGQPEYEPINVELELEEEERSWSSFEYATLDLLVREKSNKDKLNRTIRLMRWEDDSREGWEIYTEHNPGIHSLSHIDKFDLLLAKLQRADVRLIIDEKYDEDDVYSANKPEASFI